MHQNIFFIHKVHGRRINYYINTTEQLEVGQDYWHVKGDDAVYAAAEWKLQLGQEGCIQEHDIWKTCTRCSNRVDGICSKRSKCQNKHLWTSNVQTCGIGVDTTPRRKHLKAI